MMTTRLPGGLSLRTWQLVYAPHDGEAVVDQRSEDQGGETPCKPRQAIDPVTLAAWSGVGLLLIAAWALILVAAHSLALSG